MSLLTKKKCVGYVLAVGYFISKGASFCGVVALTVFRAQIFLRLVRSSCISC